MSNQPDTSGRSAEGESALIQYFANFLETAPSFATKEVRANITYEVDRMRYIYTHPAISLYCSNDACERDCYFDPLIGAGVLSDKKRDAVILEFVEYRCRHCRSEIKTFALRIIFKCSNLETITAMKFGEDPPAIGPTPRALMKLLGDQRDMYIKGRKAELAGLGVGAFVYYRRVIEHIWHTVLDRMIEVAKIERAEDRLRILATAKEESTFTRSIDAAKSAVPVSLFIDGHNPFQALYDACGDGVHDLTDEQCVRRAAVIRLVLTRFAERARAALAEDQEFRTALGALAGNSATK